MIQLSRSKRTFLGLTPEGKKRWALDASLHLLQFRENGGAWQDIDPSIELPDTDTFTIQTAATPYWGRIGDDSHRRIYPDRTDLSCWIQFEKPFPSMPAPTRSDRWFYWDFPNALIGVRFENSSIKFGFRLKNVSAPNSLTIPFSTSGLTRTGNILYRAGQPIAELRKPVAVDANDEVRDCDVTFGVGEVTISLDTTGLTFPIDIDPSIDVDVGASDDDADETFNGVCNTTRYYTISKSGGAASTRYWTGWRFTSGSFPALGDTIDVAYITVYITSTSYDDIECDLYFEKSGASPVAFSAAVGYDIQGRTKTTAWTDWNATSMGAGTEQSPSLVTPLQEVIDNYSPTALVVLLYPGSIFDREMRCNAYDPPGTTVTALHIEWTSAGGGAAQASEPQAAKLIAGKMI